MILGIYDSERECTATRNIIDESFARFNSCIIEGIIACVL